MEKIKKNIEQASIAASCMMVFSLWNVSGQGLHENAVSVDSVWNSDSSWYDLNGILQQRFGRDCRISFLSQDTGYVAQCSVSVSLDSGKTWAPDPNPLSVLADCSDSIIHQGQKCRIDVRVMGQDRPNVVFKIETSICKTTQLKNLIVTNQIPGWVIDSGYSDSAMPFTDSTSGPNFVDGGNINYCGPCNGHDALNGGIGTYFVNPQTNHKVEVFVLDYGTIPGAKAEFNSWVNKNNALSLNTETILPFSNTTAIGFEIGGGLRVYANFVNYYVELQFDNYNLSNLANPDASTFLNYYNSVMSQ